MSALDRPAHLGEVQLGADGPQGFRLLFPDLEQLSELAPPRLVELAREVTARFDLVPGHWLKLGLGGRCALNYEVPPFNHYPITTLRMFLRRYGQVWPGLERALAPALEQQDSRWGVTLELTADGPRPRLFGRFSRTLLEGVVEALIAIGLADASARPAVTACSRMAGSPFCYLSLAPGSLGVDLEELPIEDLGLPLDSWPKLPEPLVCPYAKFRQGGWTAYLPWPAYAAWWKPTHSLAAEALPAYLERVKAYYEEAQPHYLEHLGTTWQAGRVSPEGEQQSNRILAERARLAPGQRVLDAGCGVLGPALDMARAIPDLVVEGVTLCPSQHQEGQRRLKEAGLEGRVGITRADFHHLPFPDGSFQRVLYLESSGYAHDRARLFAEAFRVLEPGGLVYIKDVFRLRGPLSFTRWQELAAFDQLYAQRTPTLEETVACLRQAGFAEVRESRLEVSMEHYQQAMRSGSQLTSLGRVHPIQFRELPVFFAEVLAVRPSVAS